MKKLLSFLVLIILAATFIVFNNDMFLFTLFTQNQVNASSSITEELASYQNWRNYDLTIYEKVYDDDLEQLMENTVTLKVNYDGTNHSFIAEQTLREKDGATDETTEFTYYFTEGVLYTNNKTTESKTQSVDTYENAIMHIIYNPDFAFIGLFDVRTEFEEFDFSAQVDFSFSPFYVGQKYSFADEIGGTSISYTFHYDMFRNYRGIDVSLIDAENPAGQISNVKVLNTNDSTVTLTFPTDLETYL